MFFGRRKAMGDEDEDVPGGFDFDMDLARALVERGHLPGINHEGITESPAELAIRVIDDLSHMIVQLSGIAVSSEELFRLVDKKSKLN